MLRTYTSGDMIWLNQNGKVYRVVTDDGMYWSENGSSLHALGWLNKLVWKAVFYLVRGVKYILE